jgi:oligoribonuclease NrnB/cAMP/cGMP phosphodiesterase (DHH superfamily)
VKTIIISHESDVDGIFSASIGLLRFPQAKIFFTSYGKEDFQKMSNTIREETSSSKINVNTEEKNGQIIISDLGLNEDMIEQFRELLAFLKSNQWTISWIDHHPWSEKAIDTAKEAGVRLVLDNSENLCASELMYKTFLIDNQIAKTLSTIAHTTDFFTKDQVIPPLPELITFYKTFPDFYERLSEMAKKVSHGILWDIEMQNDFNRYTKIRDQEKEKTFEKIITETIENGLKICIIPASPYLQTSLFAEEVFEKTHGDVAFFVNSEGKVSIRRNNKEIDCEKVAAYFLEGGGHKFAAGARLRSNPSNVDEVLIEIRNAVSKSFYQ